MIACPKCQKEYGKVVRMKVLKTMNEGLFKTYRLLECQKCGNQENTTERLTVWGWVEKTDERG